ncbi:ISL3 family transposase [Streptomyces phaeochromogenes]|uniref:ISL3 family transposase n=1 Tax=Streptomyces phaeochromogenes TaxID=1923 RepID=UPI003410BF76
MKGTHCLSLGILLLCVVELPLLLPHLTGVRVVSVDATAPVVLVQARTRDEGPARCTGCGITSDRVHSRYVRHLADRAIGGRAVRIGLSVRRLYCQNPACPKVTFAEQIDGLTVRYQRRTPLLQKLVEAVGVLLAGRGGARLLGLLSAPLSRTSVLFQLMRVPLPTVVTPRVLGVDDFALYAEVYGTLLVDGDTRLPITLWEGRDAASLAAWLREHPGVKVVCRDGSLTYRQGITNGAPQALQISDRFHLWQGLSRRVQDVAAAHRSCLTAAVLPSAEQEASRPPPDAGPSLETTRAGQHAKRLFEAVREHADTGRSISAIARELGLNRRTVHKYARASSWQEVVRRPRLRPPTALTPYLDYLRQRWDEGEHSATILHQELVAKGHCGHYQRVKVAVSSWRDGALAPQARAPSPLQIARWIITPPERRHLDAAERLRLLFAHCPELTHVHELVREFAAMLDQRNATGLPGWLEKLATCGHPTLAGLGKGIREDQDAVIQGITTPYSSGMNEGRVTDVKLQKRIMAGRAGVPLLRQRVVLIAHLRRHGSSRTTSPC